MRTFPLALFFLAATTPAQIPLSGAVFDGNGGPLLSGTVYHVIGTPGSCGLSVPQGQTLTVQPGAIVKIDGCFLVAGTLNAIGTANQRIIFTSIHDDSAGGDTNGNGNATVPQPGDWATIDNGGTVRFEHCWIRYGGGAGNPSLALRNNPATLRHCRVDFGAGPGARDAHDATIEDCDFQDLAGIAVEGLDLKRLPQFLDNRAVRCAAGNYALINAAGQLAQNLALGPRNSVNNNGVFVLDLFSTQALNVTAGAVLTLPGGTVFKFLRGRILSSGGTIDVQGSPGSPVVFTSVHDDTAGGDTQNNGSAIQPQPGDWRGFLLQNGDLSTFRGAVIRYAGAPVAVELNNSSALFMDCTVERGPGDAFRFVNLAAPPARLSDCTIRNNAGLPAVDLTWTELAGFAGNSATGNGGGDHFRVVSERLATPLVIDPGNYPGEVVEVANRVDISSGGRLELEAGVIVKWSGSAFASGINVNTGGRLVCRGTARRPVVFTSFRDDSQGGDTNGDGNASQPAPGDWGRIWVGGGAATSTLENTLLRYGGGSGSALFNGSAALDLRQVRVDHSSSAGLVLQALAGPLANPVVDRAAGDGIQLAGGAFDVLHGTVSGCGGAGITRTGGWTGAVRNSIAWNNAMGNFGTLAAGDVFFSDGGFAGTNGNLQIDPQFVAPSAASADLRLRATSPCLGVADVAAAQLVQKDHDETSRLQDHALTGSLLPDMGAHELAAYRLDVSGESVLGQTMTFTLQGPGGIGSVFLGLAPGPGVFFPPLGFALLGFPNAPLPGTPVSMGQPVSLALPASPAFHGTRFQVQGIGLQLSGTLAGGFTNVDRNRLRFD